MLDSVKKGDLLMVKKYIEEGADVNYSNENKVSIFYNNIFIYNFAESK